MVAEEPAPGGDAEGAEAGDAPQPNGWHAPGVLDDEGARAQQHCGFQPAAELLQWREWRHEAELQEQHRLYWKQQWERWQQLTKQQDHEQREQDQLSHAHTEQPQQQDQQQLPQEVQQQEQQQEQQQHDQKQENQRHEEQEDHREQRQEDPHRDGDAAPAVDGTSEAGDPGEEQATLAVDSGVSVLLPSSGGSHTMYTVSKAVRILLAREPRIIPSKAPLVLLGHQDPDWPVRFGRWFGKLRAPVALLQTASKALTDYLRSDPMGPFVNLAKEPPCIPVPKDSTWTQWSFQEDNKEQLLKADWHSVPHLQQRSGLFVPRLAKWGSVMRAPPRIVAFMMAFRAVNSPIWSAITEALTGLRRVREEESQEYREEGRGKLLGTFIECFKNNRHFGIVEAQVGFGDEPWRQPSHKDGATSLLHLGVTLGGHRTLRAGLFPICDAEGNNSSAAVRADEPDGAEKTQAAGENNVWDEELWTSEHLVDQEMNPGSIYLSSPFCFEHAVQYRGCESKHQPMISLMCRWGFPEDLGRHINEMRSEDMLDVTTVIANILQTACAEGQLRLPSLDEVKQGESRLARLDREEEVRLQKVREERAQRRRGMKPLYATYMG